MKIKMLNNKVGVEKLTKSENSDSSMWVKPEIVNNLGIIKFVNEDEYKNLKVGMKVYFGRDVQEVKMKDSLIQVMSVDNLIAIVED